MKDITFDVEVKIAPGGQKIAWNHTNLLGVACAVTFDHHERTFRIFGDTKEELLELRKILLEADRVSGFNSWNFDIPVVWAIEKNRWTKSSPPDCWGWPPAEPARKKGVGAAEAAAGKRAVAAGARAVMMAGARKVAGMEGARDRAAPKRPKPEEWGWAKADNVQDDAVTPLKLRLNKKSNDLLRRMWIAEKLDPDNFEPTTHGGYSLDRIAHATIGERKTGKGEHAPELYKQGRWGELASYCMNDVKITAKLVEFVDKYGYVVKGQRVIRV